jgi:hypothetical protein
VFDLCEKDRLVYWKEFRNKIELSESPFEETVKLWNSAPFVNDFLDYNDPSTWPDPWHLIIDNRYDQLALCLGMLYTIKLTQRFSDTYCEIHMSISGPKSEPSFFLIVDQTHVLNFEYGSVSSISVVQSAESNKIWAGRALP